MKNKKWNLRTLVSLVSALLLVFGSVQPYTAYADDISVASDLLYIYFYGDSPSGQFNTCFNYSVHYSEEEVTLRKAGIALPEYSSEVEGATFTGWVDLSGQPISEDTVLKTGSNSNGSRFVSIYANYDKAILHVLYEYVANNDKTMQERKVFFFKDGTLVKDALTDVHQYVPENVSMGNGKTFDCWIDYTTSAGANLRSYSSASISCYADYKEGNTVYVTKYYVGKNGFDQDSNSADDYGTDNFIVSDNMTYGELYELLRSQPVPSMYDGLRFKNWKFSTMNMNYLSPTGEGDPVDNCVLVTMAAEYENALVRFAADPRYEEVRGGSMSDPAYYKFVLAEVGDTVEIPSSLPGADQVVWYSYEKGDSFVVEKTGVDNFWGVPVERVFTDVEKSSPYNDAIYWALFNKITKGRTDTLFSPDSGCTRGQFVTFLWRMAGEPEPVGTVSFNDMVPESSPYYKAILWAVENGITQGYSGNVFKSAEVCSRGAALTFLYRAAGSPEVSSSADFSDMVDPDHAYYNAILWGVENNVTLGYKDGTFKPFRTCSRGQNVTFLYRAEFLLHIYG